MLHRKPFVYQKTQNSAGITTVGDTFPYDIHESGTARVSFVELQNYTDSSVEVWLFDTINKPTTGHSPKVRLRVDPNEIGRWNIGPERFYQGVWVDLVLVSTNGNADRSRTAALPKGQILGAIEYTDEAEIGQALGTFI